MTEEPERVFERQRVYQCLSCGSTLKANPDIDKSSLKCCSNSSLIVITSGDVTVEEGKEKLTQAYNDTCQFFAEWLDVPESFFKMFAIRSIGTYWHQQFNTFPYFLLNGGKGTGKTRGLKILSWLQKNGNGELLNNPSESVLFRTAKERGLVFDEFESIKTKEKQAMREYLNSCYKKGGVVYRIEKRKVGNQEKMEAVPHPLYTPVAMANINGVEDVVSDRTIHFIFEKSTSPKLVKKIEDFDDNKFLKNIKRTIEDYQCIVCSVELQKKVLLWNNFIDSKYTSIHNIHTIHTIHNYTQNTTQMLKNDEIFRKIDDTGIYGRNLELFFPLLMTAAVINEDVFNDIIEIAKTMNLSKKDDEFAESKDASIIEFVARLDNYRFKYVMTSELFREYKEFVGYRGDEEERYLTLTWFGLALKRLGLIADRKRINRGVNIIPAVDKAKEKIKFYKEVKKEDETTAD